jgi:transporter family protein
MGYMVWALLSALFGGLTALWAKKGVEGVPPNLAVAIRVVIVLIFAWGVAFGTHQVQMDSVKGRAWWYLVASGLATGASWLCYFRALASGPVSRVAPIDKLSFVIAMTLGFVFLKEKPTPNVVGGAALIVAGVLLTLR